MRGLIGYTGFVGSNLLKQTEFDKLYNSKNIEDIKGEKFEFLICAGAPAVKWRANKYPEDDLATIEHLIANLREIKCDNFVLISTVDIYNQPYGVNETTEVKIEELAPYGKHRYLLEQFVKEHFHRSTIIRLPGLFGVGLKKNIIYDFMYNNCIELIHCENVFQFYNLNRLYDDIKKVLVNNITLINFATEPLSVKQIAKEVFEIDFEQIIDNTPVFYNMKSKYAKIFNRNRSDYMISKVEILNDIKKYVVSQKTNK